MPCKCTGVRFNKCSCKLLTPAGYQVKQNAPNGGVVMLALKNSTNRFNQNINSKTNIFVRVLENLYENCAAYNMRYCPFRGYVGCDNYLHRAARDCLILSCFFMANFIVFLIIIARMSLHLGFIIADIAGWVRRSVTSIKLNNNEARPPSLALRPGGHDFCCDPPPTRHIL